MNFSRNQILQQRTKCPIKNRAGSLTIRISRQSKYRRFDNERARKARRRRSLPSSSLRRTKETVNMVSRGNETRQVVGRPYAATSMHLNWLRPHSSCSGSLPPLIARALRGKCCPIVRAFFASSYESVSFALSRTVHPGIVATSSVHARTVPPSIQRRGFLSIR